MNQAEPLTTRVYPESESNRAYSELEKRARQIGTIAGQVVMKFRAAKGLREPGGKLDDLRSKATGKAGEIRDQMSARAAEWRDALRERSIEFRRQAHVGYTRARERTDRLGHDYPWHVLLAAGIAGFVLGALLRARRNHHAV